MRILDIISTTAKRIAKQYPDLSEEFRLKLATEIYKAESLDGIEIKLEDLQQEVGLLAAEKRESVV